LVVVVGLAVARHVTRRVTRDWDSKSGNEIRKHYKPKRKSFS
jgi:hypothetical protein